jgi:cytoskeleton protein RodZ
MGAYLRATRRKRRVSIERAAEETRIRADFLMRMESDEYDFLAPAYVRGFLRSYARYLRVDPDPLVTEFDRRYGSARTDTDQIVAMERRARKAPRERRRLNSWAVAATLAAGVLALISLFGIFSTPGDRPTRTGSTLAEESPTPTATPTAESTESPEEADTIALEDGITVEIIAARDACWVDVTADGSHVYTSPGSGLPIGETAGPFTAEDRMDIVLGNAGAVDIVINGRTVKELGEPGEVLTLKLPQDVEALF